VHRKHTTIATTGDCYSAASMVHQPKLVNVNQRAADLTY
jgi:hypothetical protein